MQPQKSIKIQWLMVGSFLASLGNACVWPLTTIYVHQQLHESLTVAGLVLLVFSGGNVVGSYLGGWLFDRFDPWKLMLLSVFGTTVTMAALIFFNGWPAYPTLLAVVGFMNGWVITTLNSYGTRVNNIDGRAVFNLLYFSQNLGMVIGTTIVGPFYQYSGGKVGPLFVITTLMFIAFEVVVFLRYRISKVDQTPRFHEAGAEPALPRANVMIIWTLFTALMLTWAIYEQWASNLSVYVTDMGISMTKYSLLWTINGILIVVSQLVLSRLAPYISSPYHQVYVGLLTVAASFFFLLFAHSYLIFVLSIVVLTIGEATAFPTIPGIVNELSPVGSKGRYQGILNSFASAGKAVGPLVGGMMIEGTSYRALFIACFVGMLIIELLVVLVVRGNEVNSKRF